MKLRRKYHGVRVEHRFLSGHECLKEAHLIIAEKKLSGMSRQEIAEEIFAHTYVYYLCERIPFRKGPVRFLMSRADPIDMAEGGDTPLRKLLYHLIWKIRCR
ncbi:MAG: hypothetical protein E7190_06650 [Erysipelotrichaceae bacterium]|nr:hypothetical protein [Erysipelotrichaceae bacterium]